MTKQCNNIRKAKNRILKAGRVSLHVCIIVYHHRMALARAALISLAPLFPWGVPVRVYKVFAIDLDTPDSIRDIDLNRELPCRFRCILASLRNISACTPYVS